MIKSQLKTMILLSSLACLSTLAQGFADGNSKSDGLVKNPDLSVTINNPKLLRGDETLPINGWTNSAPQTDSFLGTCRLFGFSNFLRDTVTYDSVTDSALLSADGTYSSRVSGNPIKSLTCFNEIKMAGDADMILKNPDGSVTFKNPHLLYGSSVLPIDSWDNATSNANSVLGTCRLFGFSNYLADSIKYGEIVSSAQLAQDGSYVVTLNGNRIAELSCFNDGKLQQVGEAEGVIHYRDGNLSDDFKINGRDLVKDHQ
jgi:hypothetical protein